MELVISENRRTKRGKILFGRLLPVCRQRRIRPGKRTVSGAFRRPGHQMGEKPQTVLRGKRLRRLRALCEAAALEVRGPLFELFGINRIAVENYEFPFTTGQRNQAWRIAACSDNAYKLLIKMNELRR